MQIVKLRKTENSVTVTLPAEVVKALHLRENESIAVDVVRGCIVLTRVTNDFQDAWNAYKEIEPRYRNANQKLAE